MSPSVKSKHNHIITEYKNGPSACLFKFSFHHLSSSDTETDSNWSKAEWQPTAQSEILVFSFIVFIPQSHLCVDYHECENNHTAVLTYDVLMD